MQASHPFLKQYGKRCWRYLILFILMVTSIAFVQADPPDIESLIQNLQASDKKIRSQALTQILSIEDWFENAELRSRVVSVLNSNDRQLDTLILHALKNKAWPQDQSIKNKLIAMIPLNQTHYTNEAIYELLSSYDWIHDSDFKYKFLAHLNAATGLHSAQVEFIAKSAWYLDPDLRTAYFNRLHLPNAENYIWGLRHHHHWQQDPLLKSYVKKVLAGTNHRHIEQALKLCNQFTLLDDPEFAPLILARMNTFLPENIDSSYTISRLNQQSLVLEGLGNIKGKKWFERPELKTKVLNLFDNSMFSKYIFKRLQDYDWQADPELKGKLIQLLKLKNLNESNNKELIFSFIEQYNWYQDTEIKQILIDHLSQGRHLYDITQLMLTSPSKDGKRIMANPDIMVIFSQLYLQLPEKIRVKLLAHNRSLIASIDYPPAERLILQDTRKLLKRYQASEYAADLTKLLVKKMDHPEVQQTLFEYAKLIMDLNLYSAQEILNVHLLTHQPLPGNPSGAKLVADYYYDLLKNKKFKHPLFETALGMLSDPRVFRHIPKQKFLNLTQELKSNKKLDRINTALAARAQVLFEIQYEILSSPNFKAFEQVLETAVQNNDFNMAKNLLLSSEQTLGLKMASISDMPLNNFDDLFQILYQHYYNKPEVIRKMARLDALSLTKRLSFDEREMRFVDFIEGLEDPRHYLDRFRQHLQVNMSDSAIDQFVHGLAKQGAFTANDPLGVFTRDTGAKNTRAMSFIQCMLSKLK